MTLTDNYRYHHYNNLGSTMKLTDSEGEVTASFTYGTYGELLSGSTGHTRFLYNGRCGVLTDGNGLYYMRQRYYNPELKRFVNQDVLSGDLGNSQSLNRYSYVQGNPVSYTDPFGLSPLNGLFTDTTWVHCLFGLLGFVPGIVGIVANLADALVYGFVDKDFLMVGLSLAACVSLGASRVAGYAIKTGKAAKCGQVALEIGRYSQKVWAGLGFVKGAENMTKQGIALCEKYLVEKQKVGPGIFLEEQKMLAMLGMCVLGLDGLFGTSREIQELERALAGKTRVVEYLI